MPQSAQGPIPVTLLTGFLGSGKTTLINRALQEAQMADTLVIINEFGQTALDHLLVAHSQENLVQEMGNGCVCCTIRRDLVQTLRDITWRFSRAGQRQFSRVFIETTGLADPAPIIHTLLGEPQLAGKYRLDAVVTVVDLEHASETLRREELARRQVALADLLVLSKRDCVDADREQEVSQQLAGLNQAAQRLVLDVGQSMAPYLLALGDQQGQWAAWEASSHDCLHEHHHDHHHDHGAGGALSGQARHGQAVSAISVAVPEALNAQHLSDWLDELCRWAGPRLLRLKAVLAVQGRETAQVVHAVQHRVYPFGSLSQWPWPQRQGRLVLITQDLEPAQVWQRLRQLDASVRAV